MSMIIYCVNILSSKFLKFIDQQIEQRVILHNVDFGQTEIVPTGLFS